MSTCKTTISEIIIKPSPIKIKTGDVFWRLIPLKIKTPPATPINNPRIPTITTSELIPSDTKGVKIPEARAAAAIM